jgi:Holliday junction resolvasome RuvABC DNA-binding subunit
MSGQPRPLAEMYSGIDAARIRKLLRTAPGKAIIGLHLVTITGNGHPEIADLETFTRPQIYDALKKLGYKEREIHAAMHVVQGVTALPPG